MKLYNLIKKIAFRKINDIPFEPVFIIGCGRSGTTILGRTIGNHKNIKYLNERRDIWHKAYPDLDIWSDKVINPKLFVSKEDVDPVKSNNLKRMFVKEQMKKKHLILLEKLPINNFRLDFINEIFPESKFIYLHRNGLEVSNSIAKRVSEGWFGKNNLKLDLLLDFAANLIDIDLTDLNNLSDTEKGLLEWRLSIEQSDLFFSSIEPERFISLSYQTLLERPAIVVKEIFVFLKLNYTSEFVKKITNNLIRKNSKVDHVENDKLIKLGGSFLHQSINNTYRSKFKNEI